jgi:hypothetical protein
VDGDQGNGSLDWGLVGLPGVLPWGLGGDRSQQRVRTHLAAEGGAEESPEVADDILAAVLRLLGGVDA